MTSINSCHVGNTFTGFSYLVLEHLGQWVHVHPLGNNVETKHMSIHTQSTHCLKLVLALIPEEKESKATSIMEQGTTRQGP